MELVPVGDFSGTAKHKADSVFKNEAVMRRLWMSCIKFI
jgi:hypothetical protein